MAAVVDTSTATSPAEAAFTRSASDGGIEQRCQRLCVSTGMEPDDPECRVRKPGPHQGPDGFTEPGEGLDVRCEVEPAPEHGGALLLRHGLRREVVGVDAV